MRVKGMALFIDHTHKIWRVMTLIVLFAIIVYNVFFSRPFFLFFKRMLNNLATIRVEFTFELI